MRGVVATPSPRLARGVDLSSAFSLLSAALVSAIPIGCKCGGEPVTRGGAASVAPSAASAPSAAPAPAREALLWDFAAPDEPTLLSLWPADTAAPRPSAPGVKTTNEQGAAVVVVEGTNPHAEWAFNPPLKAGMFSLELDSAEIGQLGITWRSKDCPAAVDACSATERLGVGREVAEVALLVSEINALRISFPERVGTRLVIHRMRLLAKPKATGGWREGDPNTKVTLTAQGMEVVGATPDPTIVLQVAGFEASMAGSVELYGGVGEFAPQVFWYGTKCPNFAEECSVRLKPGDGPGRFVAELAEQPTWTGRIEGLRVDPGDRPGTYLVKRVVLRQKSRPKVHASQP